STPARTGRDDSNQIEVIAPSSATPPRWPALTSAKTGGKYIATSQKTGPAMVCRVAITLWRTNRPATTHRPSNAVQTWIAAALGRSATGTASSATGGGLTNAYRVPGGAMTWLRARYCAAASYM